MTTEESQPLHCQLCAPQLHLGVYHNTPSAKAGPPQAVQTWVCVDKLGPLSVSLEPRQDLVFIHNQWLLLSAVLHSTLMVFLWTCSLIPKALRTFVMLELATKPLQPTSTGLLHLTLQLLGFFSLSVARFGAIPLTTGWEQLTDKNLNLFKETQKSLQGNLSIYVVIYPVLISFFFCETFIFL